jgi:hypothetical protein
MSPAARNRAIRRGVDPARHFVLADEMRACASRVPASGDDTDRPDKGDLRQLPQAESSVRSTRRSTRSGNTAEGAGHDHRAPSHNL